jgi:hypothetical protein
LPCRKRVIREDDDEDDEARSIISKRRSSSTPSMDEARRQSRDNTVRLLKDMFNEVHQQIETIRELLSSEVFVSRDEGSEDGNRDIKEEEVG